MTTDSYADSRADSRADSKADSKAPQAIWPDIPQPLMPYSPAVKAADWIFVSGQLASDFKTGIAAAAKSANPNLQSEQALQSRFVMETLKRTLAAGGADIAKDVVRIWQWFPWDTPTYDPVREGRLLARPVDHAVSRHAQRLYPRTAPRLDRG